MLLSDAKQKLFRHLRSGGNSENTIELYQWGLDLLSDFLGDIDIHDITSDHLDDFVEYMADEYIPLRRSGDESPLTPSSLRNIQISIHALFTWAVENAKKTLIVDRPDLSLDMPIEEYREIKPLAPVEIENLVDQARMEKEEEQTWVGYQSAYVRYLIVLVMLCTGIRVSELCRLTIGSFEEVTRSIYIRAHGNSNRKTKARRITLSDEAFLATLEYIHHRSDFKLTAPLFPNKTGTFYTRSAIRHLLIDLGKRAGISMVHPHVLRHTFGRPFGRLVNASRDATRWQKRVFSPWQGNAPRSVVLVSFQGTRASCAG